MKKIFLILFLLSPFLVDAQVKHDYNWMFGYAGSDGYPDFGNTQISFNENPLAISKAEGGEMWIYISNATISDQEGNLLFYTNGCSIADATHQTMANGDSLNLGEVHDMKCDYGYSAGSQSCLILPLPENKNIYYLFHQHLVYEYHPEYDVINDQLLYTKVDMSLQNGLGGVVEKNVEIMRDTIYYGGLTAVKHSNGKDWWIVNPQDENDKYYTFLFTSEGIVDTIEQQIGNVTSRNGIGAALFTPNGEQYIRYNHRDGLFVFDFDRTTGLLSHFRHRNLVRNAGIVNGVAVSPNSRYLYIHHSSVLYQYDLKSFPNFLDSKIEIDTYDGFESPFNTNFSRSQLGPDCRIYINSTSSVDVLHVINKPDERGKACDFRQHYVQLPTLHRASIPHFPNYRLGTDYEYPCDSTIALPTFTTSVQAVLKTDNTQMRIYPNPTRKQSTLALIGTPLKKLGTVVLYNILGEQVKTFSIAPNTPTIPLDMSGLPVGTYWCQLLEEGKIVASQKVVLQ